MVAIEPSHSSRASARDPEVDQILATCSKSLKATASVFFPHKFFTDFSDQHDYLFRLLDDTSIQRLAVAAPRGFGKTSIFSHLYPAHRIMFNDSKFIVPVSATSPSSIMFSESLKRELLSNDMILKVFGSIESSSFSKQAWRTPNGTLVLPRGAGQQIRGLLEGIYRPDTIIVDDLEDSTSVRSEEQRKYLKEWFYSDLLASLDWTRPTRVIVIGTVLHEDSLLNNLIETDDSFTSVKLRLIDQDLKSMWPARLSDDDAVQMYEAYKSQGLLSVFYREYCNEATAGEEATFTSDMFQYYSEKELAFAQLPLTTIVIGDPAKTSTMKSADSAWVVVSIHQESGKVFVRDVLAGKFSPQEFLHGGISLARQYDASVIAAETTGLDDWLYYPMVNEAARRGFPGLVKGVKTGKFSKEERTSWLQPYYARKQVYHNPDTCRKLEEQLLSFPFGKLVDVRDAMSHLPKLLWDSELFFADISRWWDSDDNPVEGWQVI